MFAGWLAFFFRALQTHDKQAVAPPSGVFAGWLVFSVEKCPKRNPYSPRIEPLSTANRGSIYSKQSLCFIPTEPLFFYSLPQISSLTPSGITQNNIISVPQPQIPRYRPNTSIPAKDDLHRQPLMRYLRNRIRQCMHIGILLNKLKVNKKNTPQ